jgi:ribosomal protein S18 acetylase RimI-like enzyme
MAIARIGEVDRSEHVTRAYVYQDGGLLLEEVDWRVPPWFVEGRGSHSVQGNIDDWAPLLERDGVMLGALDEGRLVGFAIYRPHLEEGMGQLAVLHVDCAHRGQGIGRALTEQIVHLSQAHGERRLYVSATPSAPTVEFYRSCGFDLAEEVHPALFALEPEDVHLIRELDRER